MQIIEQEQGDDRAQGVRHRHRAADNRTGCAGIEFVGDTDPAAGTRIVSIAVPDSDADRISTRIAVGQPVGSTGQP